MEDYATGNSSYHRLKAIFGHDNYPRQYEHSLRIIDGSDLESLDWRKPLGRGQNGVVYAAVWHKPQGVLGTVGESRVPVVLKEVHHKVHESDDPLHSVLKEVRSLLVILFQRLITNS